MHHLLRGLEANGRPCTGCIYGFQKPVTSSISGRLHGRPGSFVEEAKFSGTALNCWLGTNEGADKAAERVE